MLRLIGILVGSALAVSFLLFTLGAPQWTTTDKETAAEQADDVQLVATPEHDVATDAGDGPVADVEPDAAAMEREPEPATDPDATLVAQLFAAEASREIVVPDPPEPAVEEHWYSFWSPFRSELAANGFVAKLQESTGIDYRVVKVKTGVYEVAFAYVDDTDIEAKLERIASATGLDMSGS